MVQGTTQRAALAKMGAKHICTTSEDTTPANEVHTTFARTVPAATCSIEHNFCQNLGPSETASQCFQKKLFSCGLQQLKPSAPQQFVGWIKASPALP